MGYVSISFMLFLAQVVHSFSRVAHYTPLFICDLFSKIASNDIKAND